RDDDGVRNHRLASLRILPSVIHAGKAQHTAVRRADKIWLPAVWPLEPLVVAGSRYDAPMALEGIAEHRLVGNAWSAQCCSAPADWEKGRQGDRTCLGCHPKCNVGRSVRIFRFS